MAEITLRAYIKEIDDLVEHDQLDEAIAYCRHILETYPKHLETYRLLGKAYLEAKRYGDAADLFQRVLSAVPDDFVAHIGMAIVREDEGNLDASIWHMERAFETNPANPAIQQELRRLIGRRDGLEPHKVRLTRGALARMYAHGELYPQAIAELRSALQEDPDRPDLQVLLANLYWRTNQHNEAAEVSAAVLEKLPYCRDANRIIAAALQAESKVDAAAQYHRRLAALDPYAAFVETAMVDPQGVDANSVRLQKLIWQPGQPLPSAEPARRDWAASVGEGVRAPKEAPPPAGPVPSWLEAVPSQPEVASAAAEAPAAVHPFAGAKPPSEPIPEWMRGAGWTESTGEAVEGPVSFTDEELNAPAKPAESADLAPADIPDWLRDIAPSEVEAPAAGQAPTDFVAPDEAITPVPAAMPDWGAEPAAAPAPMSAEPAPAVPEASLPQPEEAPSTQAAGPEGPPPEAETPGPQLPPWLDIPTPGATDTIVTWLGDRSPRAQSTTPASAPDWIADTGPLDKLQQAEENKEAETPAWLGESEFAEQAPPEPETPAEPAMPAWLSGVAQAASIEETSVPAIASWQAEAAPPIEDTREDEELLTPSPSAEKAPDWIRAIAETGTAPAPEPAATAPSEIAPDWLEGLTGPEEEEVKPAAAEPAADEWSGLRPSGDAGPSATAPEPDWLSGLATTPETTPGAVSPLGGPEPDWLRGIAQASEEAPASGAEPPAPDWMRGIAEPGEESGAAAPEPPAPEWLRGLSEPASSEAGVPSALEGPAPEWLRGIAEPSPSGAQVEPPEEDWRASLLGGGAEPAPEFPETPEDAAWLAGISSRPGAAEPASPVSEEPAAAEPAAAGLAPPDWLSELRAAGDSEPTGEEATEWLRDLAEPAKPDADQVPTTESGEWLRGLVIKREASRASTGGTDWLKGILENEGEPGSEGEPLPPAPEPELPAAVAEPAEEPQAPTPTVKPETPAWLQEFAEAGGQEVSPTEETVVARRAPQEPLKWQPAEPVSTPVSSKPPEEPVALPDASAAAELGDDEVYRWLETLAASQDDTESIPFPRVLESGTQPLAEAPLSAPSGPLPESPEEGLEWLDRLAGKEAAPPAEPTPAAPEAPEEEEAPEWLKSLAQTEVLAVAPSKHQPPEPTETPQAPIEEAGEWMPLAEEPAAEGAVDWLAASEPTPAAAPTEEEAASSWLPMAEEAPPEPAREEQAVDWLPMTEPEPLEASPEEGGPEVAREPTTVVGAGEETASEWLGPVEPEAVPTPESAETEGVPQWLTGESEEAAVEESLSPAEGEGSAWLFEGAAPEAAPALPGAEEPGWMQPAAEPEPGAEAPHVETAIPEWLREPVEPPSITLPEEVATAGPAEPIAFEVPVPEPESIAEPAAELPSAEIEAVAQPEAPPVLAAKTPEPIPAPAAAPRPAPRIKQAVRPDQLLEAARQSLASGDVAAAAQAYTKLVKKRLAVDDVIGDLHGALERSPNMPALWQVLGDAYMRANQPAEAVEAYRRGLSNI